jgi:hypothetical protein
MGMGVDQTGDEKGIFPAFFQRLAPAEEGAKVLLRPDSADDWVSD